MTGVSRRRERTTDGALGKRPNAWPFLTGLGLALTTLASAGCLVPQSVEPITTRKHQPPRIQLESIPRYLLAPVLSLSRPGPSDRCPCKIDLSVTIEEDDPSADLVARWFVDYDLNNPRTTGIAASVPLNGSLDIQALTRGPVVYSFAADSGTPAGPHVIEVVVAEADAFVSNSPTLPNRAVKTAEGYESAVYRFVINVQDPSGQTCRTDLPVTQVCQ